MDNFAVFILSHGRPDHIKTLKALQKGHYTGKTYIVIDNEDGKYTEDQIMEDCMEAGAEDFEFGDGVIEISATSDPNEFRAVREALEAKGYSFVEADIQKVPSTYTKIDDPELCEKMQKLLDMLDDNDDVQEVYHNWEMPEE